MRNGTGRPAERGSDCRPSPGRPWPPRSSRGWRGTPSGPGGWTSAPSSPGPDRGRGCGAGSLHRAGASGARLSAWGCGCPGGGRSSPFPALGGALASVGGLKPIHRTLDGWGAGAEGSPARGSRGAGGGAGRAGGRPSAAPGVDPATPGPEEALWRYVRLRAFHAWRCRIRKAPLRPCGGRSGREAFWTNPAISPPPGTSPGPGRGRSWRAFPEASTADGGFLGEDPGHWSDGAPTVGSGSRRACHGKRGPSQPSRPRKARSACGRRWEQWRRRPERGGVNGEGRMDGRLGSWGRGRRAGRRARNEAEASARLGP